MRATVAVIGAALCAAVPAVHAAPDDYLARLATLVRRRLDELAAAQGPKLVPPRPVTVTWKAVRLGSIDLGAPLGAITSADLDGDGQGELYAVTSREVVAIAFRAYKPVELGRVAFSGDRALPTPRDVVGTATVEGSELVAAASPWARELRVGLQGKPVARTGEPGFLVCPGERWQLVPGRNYFPPTGAAGDSYGVRCRDLVDRAGVPLRVRAQLATTGKLVVDMQRCAPGSTCQAAGSFEYLQVGVAFEIADVNHDGTPEVIYASHVAPGDADVLKVVAIGGDDRKPVFRKSFNGGVVGIAVVANAPAEAPLVIAAVRLAGATRIDLWRLD